MWLRTLPDKVFPVTYLDTAFLIHIAILPSWVCNDTKNQDFGSQWNNFNICTCIYYRWYSVVILCLLCVLVPSGFILICRMVQKSGHTWSHIWSLRCYDFAFNCFPACPYKCLYKQICKYLFTVSIQNYHLPHWYNFAVSDGHYVLIFAAACVYLHSLQMVF